MVFKYYSNFFVKHVAGTDLQCGLCAGGVLMLS